MDRCANQIHQRSDNGAPDPTHVCSCAAGLVHMHDCPVSMGLECTHFRALEGEPDAVSAAEHEDLHSRLMQDFLLRPYYHRIRSLAPAGNPWLRRRDELYAYYATLELGEAGEAPQDEDDVYEAERDRLIAQRKKREEARKEREERTKQELAEQRARRGIKTVVEKAQEAVAVQGNIASSRVDDVELPGEAPRKRRRRRRRKSDSRPGRDASSRPPEAANARIERSKPAGPEGEAGAAPKRRRRRRRRGRRSGKGPGSAPA